MVATGTKNIPSFGISSLIPTDDQFISLFNGMQRSTIDNMFFVHENNTSKIVTSTVESPKPHLTVDNKIFPQQFIVRSIIGSGSFGQVVRATDTNTNTDYAIKLIEIEKSNINVESEISALKYIKSYDNEELFLTYICDFRHYNYHYIVFELLGQNLYEILKQSNFNGLPVFEVINISHQLVRALSKLYDLNLIHCDIKPENIATVCRTNPIRIKIIDFGSACSEGNTIYRYIQSRFYRAPEVILELSYNYLIDMWSVGCVIVELLIGSPLFCGNNEFEQIYYFSKILGPMPYYLANMSSKFDNFFVRSGSHFCLIASHDLSLQNVLPISTLLSNSPSICYCLRYYRNSQVLVNNLLDMIFKMLVYDPNIRIKPYECVDHLLFKNLSIYDPIATWTVPPNIQPCYTSPTYVQFPSQYEQQQCSMTDQSSNYALNSQSFIYLMPNGVNCNNQVPNYRNISMPDPMSKIQPRLSYNPNIMKIVKPPMLPRVPIDFPKPPEFCGCESCRIAGIELPRRPYP